MSQFCLIATLNAADASLSRMCSLGLMTRRLFVQSQPFVSLDERIVSMIPNWFCVDIVGVKVIEYHQQFVSLTGADWEISRLIGIHHVFGIYHLDKHSFGGGFGCNRGECIYPIFHPQQRLFC